MFLGLFFFVFLAKLQRNSLKEKEEFKRTRRSPAQRRKPKIAKKKKTQQNKTANDYNPENHEDLWLGLTPGGVGS